MTASPSTSVRRFIAAAAASAAVLPTLLYAPASAQAAPRLLPPSIGILPTAAAEGTTANGRLVFPVDLSRAAPAPVTVKWAAILGTATSFDVEDQMGTLTIPKGAKRGQIVITTKADQVFEKDETFRVKLASVTGARIARSSAMGKIINDDAYPIVLGPDRPLRVPEGTGDMPLAPQVLVTLSNPNASKFTLRWRLVPSSLSVKSSVVAADLASDVTSSGGTIVVPANSTSVSLPLPVVPDRVDEPDETMTLELSTVGEQSIQRSISVVIADDDETPATADVTQQVTLVEGSDKAVAQPTVTIPLKTVPTTDATFSWAVKLGTAVRADVTSTSGSVTLPAGSTELTVPLPINADATDEPDESFAVSVTAGAGAKIDGDGLVEVTILDDDSPAAPVVTGFIDEIGQNPTPRLYGTGKTGTVRLYLNESCTGTPVATAPAGAFTTGVPVPMPANTTAAVFANTLSPFAAEDQAESADLNLSSDCVAAARATYTHDDVAPAAADITSIAPMPYRPADISTIFGNAEPLTVVNAYALPNCIGIPFGSVGGEEFAIDGLPVTAGTLITDVPVSTSFSVTDKAGNVSCRNWRTFTFDKVAPVAPTLATAALIPGMTPAGLGLKGSTPDTDVVKVEVMDEKCATVLDSGVLTDLTSGILHVPGTHSGIVKVRATDATGNVGPCSTGLTVEAVLPIPPSAFETPAAPADDSPVFSRNAKVANAMLGDDAVDWFGVRMTGLGSWSFTAGPASGTGCAAAPPVSLQLLNADGAIVASGSAGPGTCAELSPTTVPALMDLAAGSYWLRIERDIAAVWPADGYLGTMGFRYAGQENEPNNRAALADDLAGGQVCPTNLPLIIGPGTPGGVCANATKGDVDWFTFQANPVQQVRVDVGGCINADLPAPGYKATQTFELYDSAMRLQATVQVNPGFSCQSLMIRGKNGSIIFDTRYYVKVVTVDMAGGGDQPYQLAATYR